MPLRARGQLPAEAAPMEHRVGGWHEWQAVWAANTWGWRDVWAWDSGEEVEGMGEGEPGRSRYLVSWKGRSLPPCAFLSLYL